ncbi:hypothetical protein GOBAR_AA04501 [Gossypium barbadense]|uniref:Uncharacterized protein n=1 Tax=Gossypium barbadense TaxID=3634 RepID=A0A2P5YKI1_GOSBA|nr:hypothetical protein GOBAR_AA04501 [Gossypium barbadense]
MRAAVGDEGRPNEWSDRGKGATRLVRKRGKRGWCTRGTGWSGKGKKREKRAIEVAVGLRKNGRGVGMVGWVVRG